MFCRENDSVDLQTQPADDEIADFPSPVSSVCTFDDRRSWLTYDSRSTAPTDDEASAAGSVHIPSQESLIPLPDPHSSESEYEENSAKHRGEETPGESSTSTSVDSPGVQGVITPESSPAPSAAGAPITTFVIYTPHKLSVPFLFLF